MLPRFVGRRLAALVAGCVALVGVVVASVMGWWLVAVSGAVLVLVMVLAAALHLGQQLASIGTTVNAEQRAIAKLEHDIQGFHQAVGEQLGSVNDRLAEFGTERAEARELLDQWMATLDDEPATTGPRGSRSLLPAGGPLGLARDLIVVATKHEQRVSRDVLRTVERLDRLPAEMLTEIDALLQLHQRMAFHGPVPLVAGWALSPRALLQIVDLVLDQNCRTVVECGSGTSTIYLAAALEGKDDAKVIALEHQTEEVRRVDALLRANGLEARAEVRHAPLTSLTIGGQTYRWYNADRIADITGIDLLLIDGPPKATGDDARYPALPVFESRLAEDALVVLDDANRREERSTLQRWEQEYSLEKLRSMTPEDAVLRWRGRSRIAGAQPSAKAS